jgi:hypothetical protein
MVPLVTGIGDLELDPSPFNQRTLTGDQFEGEADEIPRLARVTGEACPLRADAGVDPDAGVDHRALGYMAVRSVDRKGDQDAQDESKRWLHGDVLPPRLCWLLS